MSAPSDGPDTQALLDNLDVIAFYQAQIPGFEVNGKSNTKIHCPFGCGRGRSFSVGMEKGLFCCHRCGAKGSPWAFLERKGLPPAQIRTSLMEHQRGEPARTARRKNTKPPLGPIVKTYGYVDEAGDLLFQVTRHDPKDFRQRRRGPNGEWIDNIVGVRRVLYGLPGLIDAVKAGWTIYIVEGEKDADAINGLDSGGEFYATTAPMGAKAKWSPDYTSFFKSAHVVIVADRGDKNDVGTQRALDVRHHLAPVVKSIRIVTAKSGKDAADHLAAGNRLADFVEMPEPGVSAVADGIWKPASIALMIRSDPKPIPFYIGQIVAEEDVTVISGPPKVTKSWLTSAMETDAGLGRPVLGMYPVPHALRILHADEEMGLRKIERRFKALALGNKLTPDDIELLDRNIRMYPQQGMEFATDTGLEELKRAIDTFRPHIVVFDSFAAFTSESDEKDNSARRRFYNRVLAPLKASYKLGIVVLGHPPLPSEKAATDSQKRLRGGGDVLGTCDRSLYLTKDSEEPNEFGKRVRCTLGEYVARESDGLDGPHALSLEDVGINANGQRSTTFVSYGGAGLSALDKSFTLVHAATKAILHELRIIVSGPMEMYQPDLKRKIVAYGHSEDTYQRAVNYLASQTPPLVKVTDPRSGDKRSGKWVELIPGAE